MKLEEALTISAASVGYSLGWNRAVSDMGEGRIIHDPKGGEDYVEGYLACQDHILLERAALREAGTTTTHTK